MPAAPAKNRRGVKLAERLAKDIVEDITQSGRKPGERLPSEVQMAQDWGVSRTSLREALRILEVHGLITIRTGPNGGPELTTLTAQDFARMATLHFHVAGVTFRQLLDARLTLEPRMAELAASNRTAKQVAALRGNLRGHAEATVVDQMVHYAHEFHALVGECAGADAKALSLMTSSVQGIFDIYASQNGSMKVMRPTIEIHQALADAIESRDADGAFQQMADHMRRSAATFKREHPMLIDRAVSWLTD